jgi:glucose/arabinose dehydrogenase
MRTGVLSLIAASTIGLFACGGAAKLPVTTGVGPNPQLPPPKSSLLPLVNVATATGWGETDTPTAAEGLKVAAFATGLDHPRWLYTLPNGDVLVAETNAPPKPEDGKGIKGWAMKKVMKRAGAGVPSANRITLLRDTNNDGVAEARWTFIENLNSPFGMALDGQNFYVANTDAVMRFAYTAGQTQIRTPGTRLVELPAGTRNHHWTKNIVLSRDGSKLYVAVGSNSNVAENGIDAEQGRACIWEVDVATGTHRVFAAGLRNPVGMTWEPATNQLWVSVNERDEIGSDLVPDYMTSVRDGGFYGWPYSYYGQHVDKRVKPQRPDLVGGALVPDYALGPHTASLGLAAASPGSLLPEQFRTGMFVGQHGSWNRKPFSGYRVIFIPFREGKPAGVPTEVLTGFITPDGDARGRPVGVVLDPQGALLVADDVGNTIWRVVRQ